MSCLFKSLAHFVNNIDENQMRSIICDFLQNNPIMFDNISVKDIVDWKDNMNISQYINSMRQNNTWGSALEISAFCNIFNSKVIVHHNNRKIEFLPNSKNSKYVCNISYNGNHYEHL
jgi:hypothetical protein